MRVSNRSRPDVVEKKFKQQLESIPKTLTQAGYRCLTDLQVEYKNQTTKLALQHMDCPERTIYTTKWRNFKRGSGRCPTCLLRRKAYDIEYIKQELQRYGFNFISGKYKNNMSKIIICCGNNREHQFETCWGTFQQSPCCGICAREISNKRQAHTYEEVVVFFENSEHKVLSTEYKNCKTKLLVQCFRKHKPWWVCFNDFQQGTRCPKCSESKGEKEVTKVLTDLDVTFTQQHRLQKGSSSLKLDFFVPSLSLGIEYDGQHHFEPVRFGGISLEKAKRNLRKTQQRDRRKFGLCKKQGIGLLRIKYTQNQQDIKRLIQNYLLIRGRSHGSILYD